METSWSIFSGENYSTLPARLIFQSHEGANIENRVNLQPVGEPRNGHESSSDSLHKARKRLAEQAARNFIEAEVARRGESPSAMRIEAVKVSTPREMGAEFNKTFDFIKGHTNDFAGNASLRREDIVYIVDVVGSNTEPGGLQNQNLIMVLDNTMQVIGMAD